MWENGVVCHVVPGPFSSMSCWGIQLSDVWDFTCEGRDGSCE